MTLRQQLAAIEHERWSDWQKYVHQVCIEQGGYEATGGELIIPAWAVENWTRQINTKYSELTDKEKASDMEQVDRYWPLIERYCQEIAREARLDGALFALDNETMWQYQRKCNAGEACQANRKWLLSLIQNNIAKYKRALAELTQKPPQPLGAKQ